jgi:hypothetical protein
MLAQHRVGVAAKVGSRAADAARRLAEFDREAEQLDVTVTGMFGAEHLCWWWICGSAKTSGRVMTRSQGTGLH